MVQVTAWLTTIEPSAVEVYTIDRPPGMVSPTSRPLMALPPVRGAQVRSDRRDAHLGGWGRDVRRDFVRLRRVSG
jgi:hypothetical protein